MAWKNPLQTQSKRKVLNLPAEVEEKNQKIALGFAQNDRHNSNQSVADQRIEDAKEQRENNKRKRIVKNALANKVED